MNYGKSEGLIRDGRIVREPRTGNVETFESVEAAEFFMLCGERLDTACHACGAENEYPTCPSCKQAYREGRN